MRVNEYPWFTPDFPEYNVAQQAVIPFCDQDVNMVVCFGTAVGKTVIAECCFGYHLRGEGRVVYVSPYRSLCSEKYEKWTSDLYLSPRGVAIRTGEKRSSVASLEDSGLTIMTCESFDVRTRQRSKWRDWFASIDCIVFDEAHMIGDKDRGVALEAAMMRFTALNPKCRLVLLSATMDNALELAKWVKRMNDKPTKCFVSNWRPNKVDIQEVVANGWNGMIDSTVKLASKKGGKTIVFVHSKQVGKDVLKKLRKAGIPAAFHNASVAKGRRGKIEKLFNDKHSGFDVIVATSTLGAGVNIG